MSEQHRYPPLLTAEHVADILSCHVRTAYEIMAQPNRPVWRMGKMVRLMRDEFLEQLAEESKKQRADAAHH